MEKIAFRMKLFPGYQNAYKERHDSLWPEMKALLAEKGVHDFSIFLDEGSNDLFAVLTVSDARALDELAGEPVQQRWWTYMKDIMETNPDHSPVQVRLKEVFYLP